MSKLAKEEAERRLLSELGFGTQPAAPLPDLDYTKEKLHSNSAVRIAHPERVPSSDQMMQAY